MISEQELQSLTCDAQFASKWMKYLQEQELLATQQPTEIIVRFKKWTSPGTKCWREGVKIFSLNREKFPSWSDDICDRVIRLLQGSGCNVHFLICRDIDGKPSSSTRNGKWGVATYQEVFERTKTRFADDRRSPRTQDSTQSGVTLMDVLQTPADHTLPDLSAAQTAALTTTPTVTPLPDLMKMKDNIGFLERSVRDAIASKENMDDDDDRSDGSITSFLFDTGIEVVFDQLEALTSPSSLAQPSLKYPPATQHVINRSLMDHYGDKGTYTGTVLQSSSMPHGRGKMHYESDGRIYDGDWHVGRWHGQASASFANGDSYTGQYRFDHRHGHGTYRWNNGTTYEGEFSEGRRHGKGTCTRPNVGRYVGEFVNGKREGSGAYETFDGQKYEGLWKDGHYDGLGTLTWNGGRNYIRGEWRNGMAPERGTAVPTVQNSDWLDRQ